LWLMTCDLGGGVGWGGWSGVGWGGVGRGVNLKNMGKLYIVHIAIQLLLSCKCNQLVTADKSDKM